MNLFKIKKEGFTLIEVLLVIAILAILAAIVIIAINPAKQLAKTRDTQRASDIYSILNAIHQYAVDHDGALPEELTTNALEICKTENTSCFELLDLAVLTDDEAYIVSVPEDPRCPYDSAYCSENGTGYYAVLTDGGRVNVYAPHAEIEDEISVTQ